MGAALAILIASALAADPVAKTDLGLAASAFARSPLPGQVGPDDAAGGLALLPTGTTHLLWRALSLDLTYAPTLLLDSQGEPLAARQAMRLSAALDASPRLSLLARVAASYGKNELIVDPDERAPFDFLTLMLPMVPDLLDLQSELGASYQLDPLLRADASLAFSAFGGLSHSSQRHVPLELGPDLYFGLERSLSPLTSVGGSVDLNSTFGPHDSRSDSLRLQGTLRRRLTRSLALRLSAGANAARTVHRFFLYHRLSPVLEGAVEASVPGRFSRWELLFLGGFGPHTDPFTGEQHDRFEAGALVKLALHERLALRWRVGAARELPSRDEPSASLAIAGADLAYAFRGGFSLGGGAQASLERAPGMSQSTFWTVFTRAAWSLPNAF